MIIKNCPICDSEFVKGVFNLNKLHYCTSANKKCVIHHIDIYFIGNDASKLSVDIGSDDNFIAVDISLDDMIATFSNHYKYKIFETKLVQPKELDSDFVQYLLNYYNKVMIFE